MAASRYWRLVGISTPGNGPLELSEARVYENGVLADASATLTASIAPASGSLADLRDGLTTGVVSWPYASYSQPGFALVWDFGAGAGVEFPQLRVGSGNSYASYLQDVIFQSSVDGIAWTYFVTGSDVLFPGASALMPVPTVVSDQHISKVALLLHGNGLNGSTTILDSSPTPKTVTAVGNAKISTALSKFGGSSMCFDGSGGYLSTPSHFDFDFGTGDWTIEWSGYQISRTPGEYDSFWQLETGATYEKNMYFVAGAAQGVFLVANNAKTAWAVNISYALSSLNAWHHYAVTRFGTVFTIWIDGVSVGTANYAGPINTPTTALQIGWSGTADSYIDGFVDEFRITKGIARYTSNFAVPTAAFSDTPFIQTGTVGPRTRQIAATPERLLPAVDLPPTTAHGHLREFPFFDVFNGGIGLIIGTVKEKSLPANVPLARKVWLMDEASGMVVRETWSDATTGAYEFRGVKQGVKYTVLAYDYTHTYRAVVADNLETT